MGAGSGSVDVEVQLVGLWVRRRSIDRGWEEEAWKRSENATEAAMKPTLYPPSPPSSLETHLRCVCLLFVIPKKEEREGELKDERQQPAAISGAAPVRFRSTFSIRYSRAENLQQKATMVGWLRKIEEASKTTRYEHIINKC
ncbi:hypothetical protein E3N88_27875 [Mikania micrantha]|uniref:Uncharacterized protein n=1 Tax=Mikania micrantha TaxID=192012 RepID=A0A5N6MZG5_9ASTR|nr:hypothetical protein E3N88_27875 [Mikania micrantha]